ncbi:MAG: hypothetical protein AABY22_07980 [Nanoarchaeota archaeon]
MTKIGQMYISKYHKENICIITEIDITTNPKIITYFHFIASFSGLENTFSRMYEDTFVKYYKKIG